MKRRRERERSQSEDDEEEDRFQQLHEKWNRTSDAQKALKDEGIKWKSGRWSVEELRMLKRNIRAYKKVICFASTPVPSLRSGCGLQD